MRPALHPAGPHCFSVKYCLFPSSRLANRARHLCRWGAVSPASCRAATNARDVRKEGEHTDTDGACWLAPRSRCPHLPNPRTPRRGPRSRSTRHGRPTSRQILESPDIKVGRSQRTGTTCAVSPAHLSSSNNHRLNTLRRLLAAAEQAPQPERGLLSGRRQRQGNTALGDPRRTRESSGYGPNRITPGRSDLDFDPL